MKRRYTNQIPGRLLPQLALWLALALFASTAAPGQTEGVSVTSATNAAIVVVTLAPAEGGGFTLDGEPFAGGTVTLEGGYEYVVTQAADGTWMAMYQPKDVTFPLGELGGMLTLTAQEDGTFTDADGMQVVSGQNWEAAGNTYRLTLGDDGAWTGAYVPPLAQTVELGTKGKVDVARAEDGSWWIGETALMSGDTREAGTNATGGANAYRLTLADGEWSAEYVPATVPIAGTDLDATPKEDGTGYAVEEAMLPASGKGDVTVRLGGVDEQYHVWATDHGLAGARFDDPIKFDAVLTVNVKGTSDVPELSDEDTKTKDATELRTMVEAVGTDFSVGELLGGGRDTARPDKTILQGVREEIGKLRDQVRQLVDLYDDEAINRETFDGQISNADSTTDKWDRADAQVALLFGEGSVELERETSPRRVVDAFDALLDALETEEAFAAATVKASGGVFDQAELNAAAASRTFNATEWAAEAVFGALGSTRFGAAKRQERENAKAADFDGDKDKIQVFAWSTTDMLRSSSEVQASGNATYTGRTHAADTEGNLYSGDMSLSVRFTHEQVNGLVSNLETADGERWEHDFGGEVENIFLPTADLSRSGRWSETDKDARVTYDRRAGGARAVTLEGRADFVGRLLGRGDEAGSEAFGTWRIHDGSGSTELAGAFGAQRGEDRPDPSQPLVDNLKKAGATAVHAAFVHDTILLTQEQFDVDGARFVALGGQRWPTLAEARAAIRAAATPVTLTDAEVDRAIASARFNDPARDLTDPSVWGTGFLNVDRYNLRRAFNEIVGESTPHAARTLFGDNADAGTFVVWPTWTVGGAGRFAPGAHPVDDRPGWRDPRAFGWLAASHYRFELNKEKLFGEGYGITSEDLDAAVVTHEILGDTHVEVARKEITRLRSVLRSVIALDSADASATDRQFANDRRQELFTQIQDQLATEIFGGTAAELNVFRTRADSASDSTAWTAHVDYPVNGAGVAQDAQLLTDIDDVIEALSSEGALDAAFGTGGIFAGQNENREYNGVLYENTRLVSTDAGTVAAGDYPGDAFVGLSKGRILTSVGEDLVLPASHIFNKARARLLVVTESTDFTRLGAWRLQGSRFAADTLTSVWHGANGFYTHHSWPEPFAYSPLEQVSYGSASDRAFPSGANATATYRGKTVGVQHTQTLTGNVELKVLWQSPWGAADAEGARKIGALTLTISNIEPTTPGFSALRFGLRDYPAEVTGGQAVPRPGTYDVRSLTIPADIMADADGMVGFGGSKRSEEVRVTVQPDWLRGPIEENEQYIHLGFNFRPLDKNGMPMATGPVIPGTTTWTGIQALSTNPGHFEREAYEYVFTQGAGKGKVNGWPEFNRASLEGQFVGNTAGGPAAVIGTWAIRGRHRMGIGNARGELEAPDFQSTDILGSFGADFVPSP